MQHVPAMKNKTKQPQESQKNDENNNNDNKYLFYLMLFDKLGSMGKMTNGISREGGSDNMSD